MTTAFQSDAFQNDAFQIESESESFVFGQAQANILQIYFVHGQTQTTILQVYQVYAQAQAYVQPLAFGQAQGTILQTYFVHAQAQAEIFRDTSYVHAQAQAYLLTVVHGQAQASILQSYFVHTQAQAKIKQTYFVHAQAQAQIRGLVYAQAQGTVKQTYKVFAQALGLIRQPELIFGQARSSIKQTYFISAQAQAYLDHKRVYAQAQAYIQRMAFAQAQAFIGNFKFAQAQALIAPPASELGYTIQYNGYTLPGYAQGEAFISNMRLFGITVLGLDGQPLEQRGLENKEITIRLLILDTTYQRAKEQVQTAATYLRSERNNWSRLYLKRFDRYYLAKVVKINISQDAGVHENALEYTIIFEAKPWLYGVPNYIITEDSEQ